MRKWFAIVLVFWVIDTAGAAMTDEQCEAFLTRTRSGESIYIGPLERECLNRLVVKPSPVEVDVAEPARESVPPVTRPKPAVAAQKNETVGTGTVPSSRPAPTKDAELAPAALRAPLPGSGMPNSPELPVVNAAGLYEKIYDVAPFERQVERVLGDLLHHKDAKVILYDGSGKMLVSDDMVGHRNVEQALGAYAQKYLIAYDVTLSRERSGKKQVLCAGQVSPATARQALGEWSFSLRQYAGRVVLDVSASGVNTSLIYPFRGGEALFVKDGDRYCVEIKPIQGGA